MGTEEIDVESGKVSAWVRCNLKFMPDRKQTEVLDSPAKQVLLNCTRHWGKSTLAAARAVYEAHHRPQGVIAIINPTMRQSCQFMEIVAAFVQQIDDCARIGGAALRLRNGSRIAGVRASAAALRKLDGLAMLVMDDAARISDRLYQTARRKLAGTDSLFWLLSTPNGKRGFFWKLAKVRHSEWHRLTVPAEACPRIPAAFVEEKQRTMFPRAFRQDYECRFAELREEIFNPAIVRQAFRKDIRALAID
jgi:hypothetical protein